MSPIIVGHRGVAGTHPENTRSSIEQAIALGLTWVEVDVQPTKDNILVVCHDHTLERCSDGQGRVDDRTLAELKTLDFGGWKGAEFNGEPIMTLHELLTLAKETKLNLNLEVKVDKHDAQHVVTLLKEALALSQIDKDQVLLSSFSHQVVVSLSQTLPEYRLGLISEQLSEQEYQLLQTVNAFSCHLNHENTTNDDLSKLAKSGVQVWCYTVNMPNEFPLLTQVNAVFTDYPSRFC